MEIYSQTQTQTVPIFHDYQGHHLPSYFFLLPVLTFLTLADDIPMGTAANGQKPEAVPMPQYPRFYQST